MKKLLDAIVREKEAAKEIWRTAEGAEKAVAWKVYKNLVACACALKSTLRDCGPARRHNGDTPSLPQFQPHAPATPVLSGWVCPVCGRGNAPFAASCPCKTAPYPKMPVTYPPLSEQRELTQNDRVNVTPAWPSASI